MRRTLEEKFFPYVIKPGRYTGGEPGQITKDPQGRTAYLHAFPDKYELGQSYAGLQTIYHVLNSDDRFLCERVFAFDNDAEEVLRRESLPLFSLESARPAIEFDAIGFTLPFEMVYTTMLSMIDLAGIPLHSSERTDDHPIIMAGGPAVYNPEPIAEFIDLFFIGDAEEGLPEMLAILHEMKGESRIDKLTRIVQEVKSVYVPAFYDSDRKPRVDFAPADIESRLVPRLLPEYYPSKPILPLIDTVHSHLAVEIMRGCPQGCRFCQAGPIYRPVRWRSKEEIIRQTEEQLKETGYDELTLLSLSSSDYPEIDDLAATLAKRQTPKRVSISLPSLRPGTITPRLMDAVTKVRRLGLTLAPEAGTERLRTFIRKDFPDEAIYDTVRMAYKHGWTTIKLYFMVGLPTETDEDLLGINKIISEIYHIGRPFPGKKMLNVTLSPFSPKAHTPFQWDEICSPEVVQDKIRFVKRNNRIRLVNFKHDDENGNMLQGLLGRSDRSVGKVILDAFESGCRFDGWSDHFDFDKWLQAFEKNEQKIEQYFKPIPFSANLPWSHIRKGVSTEHLIKERERTSVQLKEYIPHTQPTDNNQAAHAPAMEFGRSRKKVVSRNQAAPTRNRLRITWGKSGRYRYMSHLDNMRIFERTIRMADIPIEYSQGFKPSMKLSFGPPLPLGFTSESELIEMQLASDYMPYMLEALSQKLPEGLFIGQARVVMSKSVSLSAKLNRAAYKIGTDCLPDNGDIQQRIDDLLANDSIEVERTGKKRVTTIDIRPAIYDLKIDNNQLSMTLGIGEGGYAKPTELLDCMFGKPGNEYAYFKLHRARLFRADDNGTEISAMDL